MADRETSQSSVIVYDPVSLRPDGRVFDRIELEDILDKTGRPTNNPETGRPFDIYDIQPLHEIRMEMQRLVALRGEWGDQQMLSDLSVIRNYPLYIFDERHMSDYVNSLAHWIANDISLPQNSKILWETLNLVRLDCQYSDANKRMFCSVNGFATLAEALCRHFRLFSSVNEVDRDTVNVCREIVKLAEITGFSQEDWSFIAATQSYAEGFCGILGTLFEHSHRNDIHRIVRIAETMYSNPEFDIFFHLVFIIMNRRSTPSVDLSICANIAFAYCSDHFKWIAIPALYTTLKILIDRFYVSHDPDTNSFRYLNRVDEEFSDRAAALENVLKHICQLCRQYGPEVAKFIANREDYLVLRVSNLILNYALMYQDEDEDSFSGKHLLYAMIINKYIIESTGHETLMSSQDIKVMFDFAMSPLPGRYLFNGRPRLKELTDQVVDTLLNMPATLSALRRWTSIRL